MVQRNLPLFPLRRLLEPGELFRSQDFLRLPAVLGVQLTQRRLGGAQPLGQVAIEDPPALSQYPVAKRCQRRVGACIVLDADCSELGTLLRCQ